MKISVNIPKNNYVQPTEVREKIVQDICNHILNYMDKGLEKGFYEVNIYEHCNKSAKLYILYDSQNKTKTIGFESREKIDERRYPFYEKVRTCEMQAVFKVMQKAGYHIFGSHNITYNVHTYIFTIKPFLNGCKAEKIDFCMFID